jgi:hypothetical protein
LPVLSFVAYPFACHPQGIRFCLAIAIAFCLSFPQGIRFCLAIAIAFCLSFPQGICFCSSPILLFVIPAGNLLLLLVTPVFSVIRF